MIVNKRRLYNSKRWKDKRQYILHRDGHTCLECKKYGKNTEANIVHHIKEYEDFPELALTNSNLATVCASCHNKLHPEKGGHYVR